MTKKTIFPFCPNRLIIMFFKYLIAYMINMHLDEKIKICCFSSHNVFYFVMSCRQFVLFLVCLVLFAWQKHTFCHEKTLSESLRKGIKRTSTNVKYFAFWTKLDKGDPKSQFLVGRLWWIHYCLITFKRAIHVAKLHGWGISGLLNSLTTCICHQLRLFIYDLTLYVCML